MRITIVVTHLLGTGHLARALTLGRAFAAAGDQVTVISGGRPVPHFDSTGVEVVQLPPVQSDGTDFSNLLDDAGKPADDTWYATRRDVLLGHLRAAPADVLVTELFPFGRRALKDEFRALLDAAKAAPIPPLILASVRDILAPPSKPSKVTFADDLVLRFYDGVLVHSDPDVVPLQDSWPVSDMLRTKLHYTGFVAPPAPVPGTDPAHPLDIVVSAGGGAVGDRVFRAACDAACRDPSRSWHLLVGGDAGRRSDLASAAPKNVTIEGPRPDFRQMLLTAQVSVSMCGYNTALDVLQTGVRAILIPFDDAGEVEQTLRARALAGLPAVDVLAQSDLSGATLIDAVRQVSRKQGRRPRTLGMDGAAQTVRNVHRLHAEARNGH